jgi:hypothetical protein
MNERIKELAEQAGLSREFSVSGLWLADDAELDRFAELVRQDEREACAKACEDGLPMGMGQTIGPIMCAAAIKARGNHEQN